MIEWRRLSAQAAVLTLTLALIYRVAPARDREFNEIADFLATRFRVQQAEIPFPGLVNIICAWVRPAGVRRLKIVRFADPSGANDARMLIEIVRRALGPQWRPLLRQLSRRSGRQTEIYTRSVGEAEQLLLVRLEAEQATLLQATLDPADFARYLQQPSRIEEEAMSDER